LLAPRPIPNARRALALSLMLIAVFAGRAGAASPGVLPLAGIEGLDGGIAADAATPWRWRNVLDELRRAHDDRAAWPDPRARNFAAPARPGEVRLGLIDLGYALESAADGAGLLRAAAANGPERRVFALAPIEARTYRGGELSFRLEPRYLIEDWRGAAPALQFDADDGLGFRPIAPGARVRVRYAATGTRILRMRATYPDGTVRQAGAQLVVGALGTPAPDDTLIATGAPYAGGSATGRGYVYLAPGHTALVNPVVVVEGFDLDNSLGWDEIYALLSAEDLIETLRADGYDLVVLDFADATDHVQRNAFVLVDLLNQIRAGLVPGQTMAIVGASMGGLVGRYALAWMESQALPHDVRTFISFDSPYRGASIPLGVQYWFDFFSSESAEAATLRDILNSPAARQMLVYHFTTPASTTAAPDPLRIVFDAELSALGYPALSRNVAVANGSGDGLSQGFAPAEQIVRWNYDIGIAVIRGNVWAVPDGASAQIFQGRLFVLFSTNRTLNVSVSGTAPYDGAPGGSRNSMQQMDETPAPSGDIVALHDSHCFIPTVSALDFDTTDLFHGINADPNALASTPFEAIYAPDSNQAHIAITAQNAAWFRDEIGGGVVAVGLAGAPEGLRLSAAPNPFRGSLRIDFTLPRAGAARVDVFGIDGRRVATLAAGSLTAGTHSVRWDGADGAGRRQPAGIYFVRVELAGAARYSRAVLVR
jgi:hypothetical protein